jgi:ribulose-5-phosphate 4-epimerase/fuculose-1-phosphate aldolase
MSAVLKSTTTQSATKPQMSAEERKLRVQLAAAYRIADHLGWSELIYTHISVRIPGTPHFLINPYGLRFDELVASSLVKIDHEGNLVDKGHPFTVNKAGFIIHSAVHMAREDAQCVWHMHTTAGMAVAGQADGLLPVHMYSHNFFDRLSYHEFEGPSMRLDERKRLVKSLGPKNSAIILRNHGLLTLGRTIPEAFIRFWRLNRACEVQLAAQVAKLKLPGRKVCEASFAMGEEFLTDQGALGELEFQALLRKIDRKDATYKN